ncbi:hypothetical protein Pmar_PMAR015222, partial [Perkinsus marinus ATCC 50983]
GGSTIELVRSMIDFQNKTPHWATISVDFSDAFGTIKHSAIAEALKEFGTNGRLINWISSWLNHRKSSLTMGTETRTRY